MNYDNKEEMNNDEILNNGEYENLGETKEENYRHSGMPSQQNQRSETKNSNGPNSIAANIAIFTTIESVVCFIAYFYIKRRVLV